MSESSMQHYRDQVVAVAVRQSVGCLRCGSWCGVAGCRVCETHDWLCHKCTVRLGVTEGMEWMPVAIWQDFYGAR